MFTEQPPLLSKYNAVGKLDTRRKNFGKSVQMSSARLHPQKVLSKHWVSPKGLNLSCESGHVSSKVP